MTSPPAPEAAVLEALRESEARFAAFIDRSPAVAWMKDAEGRYVYVNETLLKVYAVGKADVLGRTDFELFPEATARELVEHDDQVRERQAALETLERIPVQGSVRSWRIWKFPFTAPGGLLHVGGLAFDVTTQLANEATVRQMQKLDSVGRLAAGVAHDFNNLLTVQQVYLSLLQEDPRLHEALRESVERVAEASARAAALTRQLVMFSRKQSLQKSPLRLNDAVRSVARMIERVLGEHIVLELACDATEPSTLADAGMIEQVLLNLALNARDAMPQGGRLRIRTAALQLDDGAAAVNPEARAGAFVSVAVSDTGSGIAPEHLPKLFEPFFTTKGVGQGTGLGLPTAHGIINQHDGWIEVTSAPGQGATFEVFLPALIGAELAPRPAEPPASTQATGREGILVVEDEAALRNIVRLVLERHGYRVFVATNGVEARAIWEAHKAEIDLLLTDLVMPLGISGLQLADGLWQERPELRVVFTTGYSPETAGPRRLDSERSTFLQKPYRASLLTRAVRELLDR